jgi:hypothetical protein
MIGASSIITDLAVPTFTSKRKTNPKVALTSKDPKVRNLFTDPKVSITWVRAWGLVCVYGNDVLLRQLTSFDFIE